MQKSKDSQTLKIKSSGNPPKAVNLENVEPQTPKGSKSDNDTLEFDPGTQTERADLVRLQTETNGLFRF